MSEFFDWEDEITSDGDEFVTLSPGTYPMVINSIEKCRDEGVGKMNGFPYAEVTMSVGTDKKATIKDRLYLAKNMEWKIGQFLSAMGLKVKGEPISVSRIMDASGMSGMVVVECQAGKDDGYRTLNEAEAKQWINEERTVYNKIKRYVKAPEGDGFNSDEFGFAG